MKIGCILTKNGVAGTLIAFGLRDEPYVNVNGKIEFGFDWKEESFFVPGKWYKYKHPAQGVTHGKYIGNSYGECYKNKTLVNQRGWMASEDQWTPLKTEKYLDLKIGDGVHYLDSNWTHYVHSLNDDGTFNYSLYSSLNIGTRCDAGTLKMDGWHKASSVIIKVNDVIRRKDYPNYWGVVTHIENETVYYREQDTGGFSGHITEYDKLPISRPFPKGLWIKAPYIRHAIVLSSDNSGSKIEYQSINCDKWVIGHSENDWWGPCTAEEAIEAMKAYKNK